MTKSGALNGFFNSFSIPAYPSNAVPEDQIYPYMTYENVIGNFGETVDTTVKLWYHTDSEAIPNAKAEEISEAIGLGGIMIPYDGGTIWIKRGTPWATSSNDENDTSAKLRQLNVILDYL